MHASPVLASPWHRQHILHCRTSSVSGRKATFRRKRAAPRASGDSLSDSDLPYHLRCLKPSPLFTREEVLHLQLQVQ